jgi:hypothetical protein
MFLQVSSIGLFRTKWAFLILNTMMFRIYSCQLLTQFSVGNEVLDIAATNTDGFVLRDTRVPST